MAVQAVRSGTRGDVNDSGWKTQTRTTGHQRTTSMRLPGSERTAERLVAFASEKSRAVLMTKTEHEMCVDSWIEVQTQGLTPDELTSLFERALQGLWRRTERTLGDVTVRAIADRALHTVADGQARPMFRVGEDGIRCLGPGGGSAREPDELIEGMRALLVEFLTVLGNLTAEILTPSLHYDLKAVTVRAVSTATASAEALPPSASEENEEKV
jgi:hypothetical protein